MAAAGLEPLPSCGEHSAATARGVPDASGALQRGGSLLQRTSARSAPHAQRALTSARICATSGHPGARGWKSGSQRRTSRLGPWRVEAARGGPPGAHSGPRPRIRRPRSPLRRPVRLGVRWWRPARPGSGERRRLARVREPALARAIHEPLVGAPCKGDAGVPLLDQERPGLLRHAGSLHRGVRGFCAVPALAFPWTAAHTAT